MAWTTPKTWSIGEVLTASALNIYNRDNLNDLDRRSTLVAGTISTAETTTSTSYTGLATAGPSVTCTVGTTGFVLVVITAKIANSNADASGFMGYDLSGSQTLAATDNYALAYQSYAINAAGRYSAVFPMSPTAGTVTFTSKYRVTAGTGTFTDRRITVIPLGA